MAQWRRDHPEDVSTMHAFWKEKQVDRRTKKAGKQQTRAETEAEYAKGEASTLDPKDD
jgi:hypothetical protein